MCRWKITILSWWFSMAMLDFQRLHWNTFDHVWSSWNARLWFPSWQPCPRMSAAAMLLLSRIRYPTRYPHCGLLCSPMRDKKRAFSMTCKYTAEYWEKTYSWLILDGLLIPGMRPQEVLGLVLSQHVTVSHFMWPKCHQSFCEESWKLVMSTVHHACSQWTMDLSWLEHPISPTISIHAPQWGISLNSVN